MKENERELIILNHLETNPFVTVKELSEKIDASDATIRRDILRIHQEGKARKVFGGIASIEAESQNATLFPRHKSSFQKEKSAIGRYAAQHCSEGDNIIIGGGSTTYQFAENIADRSLNVFTYSIQIAFLLLSKGNARVTLPGGEAMRDVGTIFPREESEQKFFASKFFLGAQAFTEEGVMQSHPLIIDIIQRSIKNSEQTYILCDSSKFSRSSTRIGCLISQISCVITDENISEKMERFLINEGVEVIIVES